MKKLLQTAGALALTAAFMIGAASCGETHSNLTQEGWEEIISYAESLTSYRVIFTTGKENEDLIVETFEADSERAEPRFTYNKVGNAAGTIADEYILMDQEKDTFRYSWDYSEEAQMWRWIKWNATPVEGEKDSAIAAFKNEYDLRDDFLGITYYPKGVEEGVGLKGMYSYLTYQHGKWVRDLIDFEYCGKRYTGFVEVENIADNIESFRKNQKGLLFSVWLTTTIDGVPCTWGYSIQSHTPGFVVNPPSNAEFISD